MNKTEIINQIASQTGLPKSKAKGFLEALLDTVSQSIRKGDKVRISGFGVFFVRKRAKRMGKNLRVGNDFSKVKNALIPARKLAAFKAYKTLADSVKSTGKS